MIRAREFIEEEFAGVQGVRCQELFRRASEADLDYDELMRALDDFPVRLRKRNLPEGNHYEWKPWAELDAYEALGRLLGYEEWSRFFVGLCDSCPDRFRAQVWQFHDELTERGVKVAHSDTEDALFELAAELLPDTPVGSSDLREILFKQAVIWLAENQPDPERQMEFTEGDLSEVWEEGILGAFRQALRLRLSAALRSEVA